MSNELERAAFEHWFSDEGENPRAVERLGAGYKLAQAQQAWVVWVAAMRAEREACARLLDPTNPPDDWTEYAKTWAECAAKIRARSNVEISGGASQPSAES